MKGSVSSLKKKTQNTTSLTLFHLKLQYMLPVTQRHLTLLTLSIGQIPIKWCSNVHNVLSLVVWHSLKSDYIFRSKTSNLPWSASKTFFLATMLWRTVQCSMLTWHLTWPRLWVTLSPTPPSPTNMRDQMSHPKKLSEVELPPPWAQETPRIYLYLKGG